MPKLTDMQIRAWIKAGDRFDGKADGNGLYICYPKNYTVPFWRFRYKLAGKQRAMVIGSYSELSLSKAREIAKELSARVALGYDVAAEKQERKAEALAKMEAEKKRHARFRSGRRILRATDTSEMETSRYPSPEN